MIKAAAILWCFAGLAAVQAQQPLTPSNVGSSLAFDVQLSGAELTSYSWDVDVRATPEVTTQFNQRASVEYQVSYDRTATGTSKGLSGTVDIKNNLGSAVVVYGVRLQVAPASGAQFFVEAECPSGDDQDIVIAAGDTIQCSVQEPLKAAAGAPPVGGRAQVQLKLTRNGGFGYTAPGPVNYDFNSPDQVEQNECALVFDTWTAGSAPKRPEGTNRNPLPGLLAIAPEVAKDAKKPPSITGSAAKICQNTVYKFTVVAGPFPAESCGSRQLYYTAFAYPAELAKDDESDNTPFPVDQQLAAASANTRITITGCQQTALPPRVIVRARPATVIASKWGVAQRVSGLTATRPSNIIAVDYRRGGRLSFNTAVTKTPGQVVSRQIRGEVTVINPNRGNVMYSGTVAVVVRQGSTINAAVTCPGNSVRVMVPAGQAVTCTYSAPVQSESSAAVQATFSTSTSTTPSSPTAVQSWSTAETLNANNCANARNVWRFTAVRPTNNVPPRLSVTGNQPNGRTCQAAAFQYAAVIPAFRPTQCGRYELVSSVTVTPVIEVAGVTSRPAVKQDRIFVDVTGCPGFAINLPGFSLNINLG